MPIWSGVPPIMLSPCVIYAETVRMLKPNVRKKRSEHSFGQAALRPVFFPKRAPSRRPGKTEADVR